MFVLQYHHQAAYDSSDSSSDEEAAEAAAAGAGAGAGPGPGRSGAPNAAPGAGAGGSGAGAASSSNYRGREHPNLPNRHSRYGGRGSRGLAHSRPAAMVPRTVFHRALDAVELSWDNVHLKNILSSDTYCSHITDSALTSGSFNPQGQPLWHGEFTRNSLKVIVFRYDLETEIKCGMHFVLSDRASGDLRRPSRCPPLPWPPGSRPQTGSGCCPHHETAADHCPAALDRKSAALGKETPA